MLSEDTTRFVSRTMSGDFFVEFRNVVRGYHVYRSVGTPVLGELLYTEQELGNPKDQYAVSVLKSSTIVGHIRYHIVITKRHLKIIPSTFGAIFRRKKIP